MYKGSNCDQKSQLSEILTEPLNPRGLDLFVCMSWIVTQIILHLKKKQSRRLWFLPKKI